MTSSSFSSSTSSSLSWSSKLLRLASPRTLSGNLARRHVIKRLVPPLPKRIAKSSEYSKNKALVCSLLNCLTFLSLLISLSHQSSLGLVERHESTSGAGDNPSDNWWEREIKRDIFNWVCVFVTFHTTWLTMWCGNVRSCLVGITLYSP